MLYEGRIPLNDAEQQAVEKLMFENDGAAVSLTRRDPGETGPVLIHIDHVTYQINDNGVTERVNG